MRNKVTVFRVWVLTFSIILRCARNLIDTLDKVPFFCSG